MGISRRVVIRPIEATFQLHVPAVVVCVKQAPQEDYVDSGTASNASLMLAYEQLSLRDTKQFHEVCAPVGDRRAAARDDVGAASAANNLPDRSEFAAEAAPTRIRKCFAFGLTPRSTC